MIQNINNKYLYIFFAIKNNDIEERIANWSCKIAKLEDDKDQKLWNDIHQKKRKKYCAVKKYKSRIYK